jgi:hypothetical protein
MELTQNEIDEILALASIDKSVENYSTFAQVLKDVCNVSGLDENKVVLSTIRLLILNGQRINNEAITPRRLASILCPLWQKK